MIDKKKLAELREYYRGKDYIIPMEGWDRVSLWDLVITIEALWKENAELKGYSERSDRWAYIVKLEAVARAAQSVADNSHDDDFLALKTALAALKENA